MRRGRRSSVLANWQVAVANLGSNTFRKKGEKKMTHQGKRHKMRENSGNNRSDPIATAQLRSQKENTLKPVSFFVFFEKKREKRVIERKKARIEVGPK